MLIRHSKLHQRYGQKISSEPALEPVSLDELKTHLNIDDTADDAYLTSLIELSRKQIEERTNLALITQSWDLTLDHWPDANTQWWDGVRQGHIRELHSNSNARALELPKFPLQDVNTVKVYDESSNETSVTVADTFDIDVYQLPGRMTLKFGKTWPIATRSNRAIIINYTSGFGDAASDVPETLKHAIKLLASKMYSQRGDGCNVENAYVTSGAQAQVETYKVKRI